MNGTIVTTRFNDETWRENQTNRERRKIECLYAVPIKMSPKIEFNSIVFVIEMNNTSNRIEGIGLIRNKTIYDKYYKIYTEENYNRYYYFGKYNVNRQQILDMNEKMVTKLDLLLFKGKTHSKRGTGFTRIPDKIVKIYEAEESLSLLQEIKNVFLHYFLEIIKEQVTT